jgi:hypothetical protein
MRIHYERLSPRGGKESCEDDLLSFIRGEFHLGMHMATQKRLPPMDQINEVLGRGWGDDGFIMMIWQPFALNAKEYSELKKV